MSGLAALRGGSVQQRPALSLAARVPARLLESRRDPLRASLLLRRVPAVSLIFATDLQTRLAVSRLGSIVAATWGLLGGEGVFIPMVAAYLFWWGARSRPTATRHDFRACAQSNTVLACICRLLRAVALERFSLFALFLYIPRPAVLAQARWGLPLDHRCGGAEATLVKLEICDAQPVVVMLPGMQGAGGGRRA